MSFQKQDIYKALETITAPGEGKSLVENKNVTNVVVFGDEVVVDVTIGNPTLQAKKKVEVEVMKAKWIHADFSKLQKNELEKYQSTISNRILGKKSSKLDLHLMGTAFQVKVWEALLRIPEGNVSTYQGIAKNA